MTWPMTMHSFLDYLWVLKIENVKFQENKKIENNTLEQNIKVKQTMKECKIISILLWMFLILKLIYDLRTNVSPSTVKG